MDIISKTLPVADRVLQGRRLITESRFTKLERWGKGLSVLNEENLREG